MKQIRINHITENGLIDYAYLYNDNIEMTIRDIDNIKDKDNYRVSIYDDEECTENEALYYSLNWFKYIYGGGVWEEVQVDQEKDQTLMNSTSYTTIKVNQ